MSRVLTPPQPGTDRSVPVGGYVLARNTALNLSARVTSLLIAVLAMPYVIRHLGPDRFGLLSLAWIVVGYFAFLDLGFGAATTKFVAEFLGKGETEKLPDLVWTALISQFCLGSMAGLLLGFASPFLVEHVLKIPAQLHTEARLVLVIMALSLPIDLANGSLQGVLAATQRFDLVNAVGIPSSALTYLVPAAALALGFGLPAIVLFLVVVRATALAVSYGLCLRLYPALGVAFRYDRRMLRPLIGYGGWVTVSSVVGPVLVYYDRFLIGALISIAAVGFYTPPYMISTKLWILPASLMATLFPAFSASAGRGDTEWIRKAFVRSTKFLLLLVGPVTLALVFFAHPILQLWLGAKFAAEGATALQILAVGVLINSLANVSYALVQGMGRPDLTAKFHLLELPLHVGLAWLLVVRFGLAGAALAWTIRVSVDSLLLIVAACRMIGVSPRVLLAKDIARSVATLAVLTIGFCLFRGMAHTLLACAFVSVFLGSAFALATWHYTLNLEERWQLKKLLRMPH